MIVRRAGHLSYHGAAVALTLVVLLFNARLYSPRGAEYVCWPFGSSARSEGPVPTQGGSMITSETHVSTGGVQGSVQSLRGRMSQTASTTVPREAADGTSLSPRPERT